MAASRAKPATRPTATGAAEGALQQPAARLADLTRASIARPCPTVNSGVTRQDGGVRDGALSCASFAARHELSTPSPIAISLNRCTSNSLVELSE